MKIRLLSIPVLDQDKAFKFYTDTLGFVVKHDIPLGEGNRWLTVVSKDEPDGPEILLEPAPLHFEPSKVYQEAIYKKGMPWAQLDVENMDEEYKRLVAYGVSFTMEPTNIGPAIIAVFDDTCGNLIQIIQHL